MDSENLGTIRIIVRPAPVVAVSDTDEKINISGAEPGAVVTLYNSTSMVVGTAQTAGSDGICVFGNISSGDEYYATQTVNGIESDKLKLCNILYNIRYRFVAAGDSKITDLTPGQKYQVKINGQTKYVKSDGTLSDSEADEGALTGTEITGLTNGSTYKAESYVAPQPPQPTSVTLESSSLGAAGDSKIIGLTPGQK